MTALSDVLDHGALSTADSRAFGWTLAEIDGIVHIDAHTFRGDYASIEDALVAANQLRSDLVACGYRDVVGVTTAVGGIVIGAPIPQVYRGHVMLQLQLA